MLVQWLSFAVTVLIQLLFAAWIMATIKAELKAQGGEIVKLRDWRHAFGPKEMIVDSHEKIITDHEARLRVVEKSQSRSESSDDQADTIRRIWEEFKRTNGHAVE